MLNVCHIISGDLWAGAEVMAFQLLKEQSRCKELDISVVLLNKGRLYKEIKKLGVKIYLIDENQQSFIEVLIKMRKIIREQYIEIIHSHRYKENILALFSLNPLSKKKLIATQHGMADVQVGKVKLRSHFISWLNLLILKRKFNIIVGVSDDIKRQFVEKHKINEKTVDVIHNGIEIPKILTNRDKYSYFTIGSAGRFFPIKDYSFFIEIARLIRDNTDQIRFKLAGDGPDMEKLQQKVRLYNLKDCFEFVGHIDDMDYFYQGLDLYINTSIHEGIPMSILEAMAYKLPIIAPNVGGFNEIVDSGIDGYLIEIRTPEQFAEKCLYLYENRTLSKKMAESAREKVIKKFSVENMAEKYYSLYKNIVSV